MRSATVFAAASTDSIGIFVAGSRLLYAAMRRVLLLVVVAGCGPAQPAKGQITKAPPPPPEIRELAAEGESHLKNVHQLTFGGDNAEAYWSFSGDRLIFQTNHAPYKCDQIEVMPMTGGPGKLISTGKGRTTCSYFLK